ncbi:MAG: hypothetical protein OEM49_12870 [Myxococcales bacterium]|nr:hypothetical protein [Myxococcales bacterium]MDH5567270.1 hypothetical protein [Myxococcales bacterium]
MNGWDAFTWLMAATLAVSVVAIFVSFLRDARNIFDRDGSPKDGE